MAESRLAVFVAVVALLSSVDFGHAENATTAVKDCSGANETCSVLQPTSAVAAAATTTPKNALKTMTVVGDGGPQTVHHYDVPGNDSKGLTLKDVVVINDGTVTPLTGGGKANGSGKATSGSSNNVTDAVVVKSSVEKTNATATDAISPIINATNTTSTSTTTSTPAELTSVSPPKYSSKSGAEIVRFVPYKYCHCDLIVSISIRCLCLYIIMYCNEY